MLMLVCQCVSVLVCQCDSVLVSQCFLLNQCVIVLMLLFIFKCISLVCLLCCCIFLSLRPSTISLKQNMCLTIIHGDSALVAQGTNAGVHWPATLQPIMTLSGGHIHVATTTVVNMSCCFWLISVPTRLGTLQ